jgi:pyruvate dehydrogenase E2 component (dihydrolipoamide acetyltransferase)
MKTFEFKLPDIGEGVSEGEIVQWLVAPGDTVVEDQPIVEVMTDKATVTITAPKAGKVLETRAAAGGVVPVHSVLVVFDIGGEASAPATPHAPATSQATATAPTEPAATAVGDIKETLPGMNLVAVVSKPNGGHKLGSHDAVAIATRPRAQAADYFNAKPLATPATRRLARELGVDLRVIAPTGPNGRVTKDDVKGFSAPAAPFEAPPQSVPMPEPERHEPALPLPPVVYEAQAPALPASRPPQRVGSPADAALEERIPLRGLRKRIFEGMSRSKHTAAHFTFVEECDVTALKDLRARLKPSAEKAGVKLTFLPFFVKATIAALKRHPTLNSAFDEATQEIVQRRYYNIGIASATEGGLIVPVVRDADRKSLLDIARDIARLSEATKSGKVQPQDLGGSTFTITSLGQQGGLFATPILNFPEVAILGIHQMKQKPVVKDGQIVIGDVMLLSLSFDHRIIDGHIGAAFAYEIISFLEDPDRLFLEMA